MTATDPSDGPGSYGCRRELALLALLAGLCWVPIGILSFPAAAALVLWLPGRGIVRLLEPVARMPARGVSEIGACVLLVPLCLNGLWMWTNGRVPLLLAVAALNLALILLSARRTAVRPERFAGSRLGCWGLAGLIGYVCTLVFVFYWLPTAFGRVTGSPSGDYVKHHAVLWSLSEYPLPLHNIFFAAEADAPYYYYHYHYLLPVAARRLAGDTVSLATAFGFTSAIVAGLFIALVFLIARHFLKSDSGALLAAVCASIVGGWDIIPILIRLIRDHRMAIVLDSWSPFPWRIHNVLDNFIWCPQHVAAVVCLLLCACWLTGAAGRRWWMVVVPLAGASVFGTSLYQAATMFVAAAIWAVLWLRDGGGTGWKLRISPPAALAVVAGVLLTALQAWQYLVMSRRYPGGLTTVWDRFDYALVGRLAPPGVLANLLDAPWLVLLELGVSGMACLLVTRAVWRAAWEHPAIRLLILAGTIGLVTMFVVRSSTTPIDYAFRAAVMPANVVAAILVGAMLRADRVRPWARRACPALIAIGCVLGVAVGVYELPVMAMRTLLQDRFAAGEPGTLRYLRDRLPEHAVVQCEPRILSMPQIIEQRMGVLDPDNPHILVLRPPEPQRMYEAMSDVEAAFNSSSAARAHELLARWGVTHVVAGPAERGRYGPMPQWNDQAFFERLYHQDGSAVYGLRRFPEAAIREAH